MKKLIAVILVLAAVLSLCACSVNKSEVSVLWAGEDDYAVVPDSLINAMDRAMYIEKIDYKHYAAAGDQAAQTAQAETCLANGCSALVVELVDPAAAQTIVDLAKAKNVPVVFFGTAVDDAVVASYAKCAAVVTDEATLAEQFNTMVLDYVLANTTVTKPGDEPAADDMDLDDDGKINCVIVGDISLSETVAIQKNKDGEPELDKDGSYKKKVEIVCLDDAFSSLTLKQELKETGLLGGTTEYRALRTGDGKTVELILVADDQQAMETLIALQTRGLNADKLATCFVPVFTVGSEADYKARIMAKLPADAAERTAYLETMRMFADMTILDQKEWEAWDAGQENEVDSMIFNTINQIGTGRLSGTVVADHDAVAEAAAKLAAQLIKGETPAQTVVKVSYTTYTG